MKVFRVFALMFLSATLCGFLLGGSAPAVPSSRALAVPSSLPPVLASTPALASLGGPAMVSLGGPEMVSASTPAPASTSMDGWTTTLIPGTDKMLVNKPRTLPTLQGTYSIPPPVLFVPDVAIDGNRVLYTGLYDRNPQMYLYDTDSAKVTQLTHDQTLSFGQPQLSGDWAAWVADDGRGHIYLRNLASGIAEEFAPRTTVTSYKFADGRLAWQEGIDQGSNRLFLYDPAAGSAQPIAAADGLRCFDLDQEHLVWAGGPDGTDIYLYDLATGHAAKFLQASQPVEFVSLKGEVVAWADRTGDRTAVHVYRLDTREDKTLDHFGPFNPELVTDGRYVVWSGGEEFRGTYVKGYDTLAGRTIDFGAGDFHENWPDLGDGRVAWLHFFPGSSGEVVMVKDLSTGLTTQLSDGPFVDHPPSLGGGHVVWARHNSVGGSSEGHGVFVATARQTTPSAKFSDLTAAQGDPAVPITGADAVTLIVRAADYLRRGVIPLTPGTCVQTPGPGWDIWAPASWGDGPDLAEDGGLLFAGID